MKSLSHMGGVRVSRRQAHEIFRNGRDKQFSIYREKVYDEYAKETVLAYRVTKDCGNVAYKDFFEKVAVPDVKERNEIFGFSRASAEKTGDIIEFWLGVLDVANMAKGVVNVFDSTVDPAEYLNGLERSLAHFSSTSRTTNTVNDKRKGSFDCTLQPLEAEAVMKILNTIPEYKDVDQFNCLTEWEEEQVISQFRKKKNLNFDDVPMADDQADTEAGDAPPVQPDEVEADETATGDDDAVKELEMSSKQQLLDALGKIFTVSEDVNVCIYCGSTQHNHHECEDAKRENIRATLKAIRARLEAESPTGEPEDAEMESPGHRKESSGATAGSDEHQEPAPDRTKEYHWYDQVRTMAEVGDYHESGRFNIEGREVASFGPETRDRLNEIVREAIMKGGGDTWTAREFMASYPDMNSRKALYKRINVPEDGFLRIIPTTGCHFHNYQFFGGTEYDVNFHLPCGSRLDSYENEVSRALNKVLRHNVGKVSERSGLRCDDAGWVPFEDILKTESIWKHEWARYPHPYLAPRGQQDDPNSWSMKEAKIRVETIFQIMFHCVRYGRRVREQILVFGVPKDIDRNSETCRRNNVGPGTVIPEDGLILYPVAIRAPNGHKEGGRDDVTLLASSLSHPIAPITAINIPSCFHITWKRNLRGIWKEGLIPGGSDGEGHRMFSFFNPYAPWDPRSWNVTKSVDTRKGEYMCLYIPTELLMNEHGGRITDSGQVVTNQIVPFSAFKGRLGTGPQRQVQQNVDQVDRTIGRRPGCTVWYREVTHHGD